MTYIDPQVGAGGSGAHCFLRQEEESDESWCLTSFPSVLKQFVVDFKFILQMLALVKS